MSKFIQPLQVHAASSVHTAIAAFCPLGSLAVAFGTEEIHFALPEHVSVLPAGYRPRYICLMPPVPII
jgi:hypothetical protein